MLLSLDGQMEMIYLLSKDKMPTWLLVGNQYSYCIYSNWKSLTVIQAEPSSTLAN